MPYKDIVLGFYYHITVHNYDNKLKLPAYLGIFIDSLASQVKELVLFLHTAHIDEIKDCDYTLLGQNIKFVSLGKKRPAWNRDIFHYFILRKHLKSFNGLDAFLLRAPTPYGPYFKYYISNEKLFYLLVGHYGDGADNYKIRNLRDRIIKFYLSRNSYKFDEALKGSKMLVNSTELYNRYRTFSDKIKLVRTTTLTNSDFYQRLNTCNDVTIKLLYTGRIDPSKGLVELIKSLKLLDDFQKDKFSLTIVGWDTDGKQRNLLDLQSLVLDMGLSNIVKFEGKKKVGFELNHFYRNADLYIFPSYFEGFPRTIWEAMANSLPIITTPVGGIPHVLEDGKSAIFCQVKNEFSIFQSVLRLVTDEYLRNILINNSFMLAQENTLEKQSKLLVDCIKSLIK